MFWKKSTSISLIFVPPLVSLGFFHLRNELAKAGWLNTKDLAFVGGETGTLFDYMTNVWVWDVFSLLVGIASFFCVLTGIGRLARILIEAREKTKNAVINGKR
ncbi:MAG TPA: hypothetical protein PLG04_04640 [Anaerolineaceae bacterium]|nr:hypothetical protein [Anaerolineaceae bacterium]HRT28586.1 hypothetical protein [Kiritimatiellia bacterium]